MKCHKCKNEIDTSLIACPFCGKLVVDTFTQQQPAKTWSRLIMFFIVLACIAAGLAYYLNSEIAVKFILINFGLVVFCMAQEARFSGRTHGTANMLYVYKSKNPILFWILTYINYIIGIVMVLLGVKLLF